MKTMKYKGFDILAECIETTALYTINTSGEPVELVQELGDYESIDPIAWGIKSPSGEMDWLDCNLYPTLSDVRKYIDDFGGNYD